MNNFVYHNPTRIVFGKGSIAQLGELVPAERKVLMTFGSGSIRKNGVYDQVKTALKGRTVVEFGGIQPNPVYEHLMEAVQIVRSESIGFLLAVGGGSVLDGTKFIAAAARYEGPDPWQMVAQRASLSAAVPLGTVLTLPATGSESNGYSVVSREATREKLAFGGDPLYPRFAILDPQTMLSLPAKQVRNGVVDAYAHVMEQYATYPVDAALQDRQAEAILLTLIAEGPRNLRDLQDYDARATLVWCATQALNGHLGCGVPQDWSTHGIGHELTAFYGIDHAESLAVVMPALLRNRRESKRAKLLQYARRIWGVERADEDGAIEEGIARTESFFKSLGMPTRLSAYGINASDAARRVSDRFTERGSRIGERQDMTPEIVREILLAC